MLDRNILITECASTQAPKEEPLKIAIDSKIVKQLKNKITWKF